jgi:hypothetical protein
MDFFWGGGKKKRGGESVKYEQEHSLFWGTNKKEYSMLVY